MLISLQINLGNIIDSLQSIDPTWYQSASTVILVLVTLYYSRILRNEVIRDRKQDHTNELRKTVIKWIGNLPAEDDGYNHIDALVLTGEFQAVPSSVINDPYKDDFLENHAPIVNNLVENIRTELSVMENNRDRFLSEYNGELGNIVPDDVDMKNDTKPVEIAFYTIVATEKLQERKDQIISKNEGIKQCISPSGAAYRDAAAWWRSPYTSYYTDIREHDSIFSTSFDESDYPLDLGNEVISDQVAQKKITEFGDSIQHEFDDDPVGINEVVSSLSKLENNVGKLRQQLERYRRQNIYSGYCLYITDSTFWLFFDKLISRRIRRWFRQ